MSLSLSIPFPPFHRSVLTPHGDATITGGLLQDDPRRDLQGHGVLPRHGAADGRPQAPHPVGVVCVCVSACVHRFIQWLTPSPSHSHSHSTAPRQCRLGIQYLKQPTTVLEDDAWTRMRGACVALYKDLLLLEHFAVMNYCGACSRHRHRHPPVTRSSRLFDQVAG